MKRKLDILKVLIQYGADVDMKCHGNPSIHLTLHGSLLPGGEKFSMQAFRLILENTGNISVKVKLLNFKQCLYWKLFERDI